jgi:cyanophycinase-like exopeptidase
MRPQAGVRISTYFITIILVLFSTGIAAQGTLLIVGGGSEKNGANSWSTPPYRWAVEGKRVAIIGMETGSLAPYMKNQCGAAFAKEFALNTSVLANAQETYDTLITYDVIFFRGGDQWDYYNLYRNSKIQDAVEMKYNEGGCIGGTSAGMHILSSVVFTAENGTVYPDECIENPNNQYITLADDFLDLRPGFVFDTHFCERGRFGRLTGFLANLYLNGNNDVTGLGMDDMTCMTIDASGLGTVYGTGCANIYRRKGDFRQNGTKLLADSVEVVQLLKGCSFDFNTGIAFFETLDRQIDPREQTETGNYTVLASGGNLLSDNSGMITHLVQECGNVSDPVLIFSGDNALAESFRNKITEAGATATEIVNPTTALGQDAALAGKISGASKMLFLKNSESTFREFLETDNGRLLKTKLHSDLMISAFAGEDARFAGKTVVGNYLTELASWYAEMTFNPGLALLGNTVIMPQTFLNSDIYENTSTAVPYAMSLDTLKYGIWLTNHSFMKISPVNENVTLTGFGTAPVMLLTNRGTLSGFSTQTGSGGSGAARQVAGFDKLSLSLIDNTNPVILGKASPAFIAGQDSAEIIQVYPNPAGSIVSLPMPQGAKQWQISEPAGKTVFSGTESADLNVSTLSPGIYFIHWTDARHQLVAVSKFVKN